MDHNVIILVVGGIFLLVYRKVPGLPNRLFRWVARRLGAVLS